MSQQIEQRQPRLPDQHEPSCTRTQIVITLFLQESRPNSRGGPYPEHPNHGTETPLRGCVLSGAGVGECDLSGFRFQVTGVGECVLSGVGVGDKVIPFISIGYLRLVRSLRPKGGFACGK